LFAIHSGVKAEMRPEAEAASRTRPVRVPPLTVEEAYHWVRTGSTSVRNESPLTVEEALDPDSSR
jgi:hypothetical protein